MEQAVLKLVQHVLETQAAALELYARAWCHAPEDVVQDAIVQLARQRPLPERPIGWLYCAVRRGAISAGRAESRRKRHESGAARAVEWFEPAVGEAMDARAAAEALSELPLEQREVLVARLWGGLNFTEPHLHSSQGFAQSMRSSYPPPSAAEHSGPCVDWLLGASHGEAGPDLHVIPKCWHSIHRATSLTPAWQPGT